MLLKLAAAWLIACPHLEGAAMRIRAKIFCCAIALLTGCSGLSEQEKRELVALEHCQFAIKRVSRNQDQTTVPYTRNEGSQTQFRFEWRQGSGLQMPNGFGALQDSTALCVVQDDRIQLLVVNDRPVLRR